MTTAFHRPLRLALALWFGALGLAPALSLADTIEGPDGTTTETPADVAPDAVAIMDPGEIKKTLDDLTIYGRYVDGENWIEYHLPDGRTAYGKRAAPIPASGGWSTGKSATPIPTTMTTPPTASCCTDGRAARPSSSRSPTRASRISPRSA